MPRRSAHLNEGRVRRADQIEEFIEGGPKGNLVDSRLSAVARDAEEFRSRRLACAETCEPFGPLLHDTRDACEAFDIVDSRRLLQITPFGREGRTISRSAALAFERVGERRFLAADIGAGAKLDADVEIEPRLSADILAKQAETAAFLKHALQLIPKIGVLAAQIDEPVLRPQRIARDRHAVEDDIGNLRQQHTILERARLAFVGVAHDVMGFAHRLPAEPPFQTGREAGSAAAAKLGLSHQLDVMFAG